MENRIKNIAKNYHENGFSPIPLKPQSKDPKVKWGKFNVDEDGFDDFEENDNVAIKLGEASKGSLDVDMDWPQEVVPIADKLLYMMPAFGRKSARRSHRVARVKGKIEYQKFVLPADCSGDSRFPKEHSLCVAEIRGDGHYTMAPGSIHPCGEEIKWDSADNRFPVIPELDLKEISERVALISFLAVVLRCYPAEGGRDDTHLALGGALAHLGFSAEEINKTNIFIAELANDEEADKRAKGDMAVARLKEGLPVVGMPTLVKHLGLPESCIKCFNGWLGIEQRPELVIDTSAPYETAKKFVQKEMPNLKSYNGELLDYVGSKYVNKEEDALRSKLYEYTDKAVYKTEKGYFKYNPSPAAISAIFDGVKSLCHINRDTMQPPCWLDDNSVNPKECIVLMNGILHLKTGTMIDPTPMFFTRNSLEFEYDPDNKNIERWLKFLETIYSQEEISLLQEIIGYLISQDTSQQKIFFIVGPKRSGKGTLLRVITALIGKSNTASPTLKSLSSNFGLQPLIGKSLATISDSRLDSKSDKSSIIENLLRISGEDYITADRKYKNPWEGKLNTRFIIVSNELPSLMDTSGAFISRFIPIRINKSFYGKENPNLTEELLEDIPAILNWAIEGWTRLNQRGYFDLPKTSLSLLDEMSRVSSPLKAFIDDMCELGPDYTVSKDDLFGAWGKWCENQNFKLDMSKIWFSRHLFSVVDVLGKRETTGTREFYYKGIRLIPHQEMPF